MPGASDRPVAISRPTGGWWRRFGECTQRAGARWQSTGTPVAAAAGRGLWAAPGGGGVGWSMGEDLSASLVEDALAMAVGRRDVSEGLLHHSDQGCQYTSDTYQGRLAELKAQVSMSGVGNCYDNAVMESFFSTLKAECATYRFTRREEARRQIFEVLEIWYNRQRMHSSLDYLSPAEHESRVSSDMISVH